MHFVLCYSVHYNPWLSLFCCSKFSRLILWKPLQHSNYVLVILWTLSGTVRLIYSRIISHPSCLRMGFSLYSKEHSFLWLWNEILIVRSECWKSFAIGYWSAIASRSSHWSQPRNMDVIDILTLCRFILFPCSSICPSLLSSSFQYNLKNHKMHSHLLYSFFWLFQKGESWLPDHQYFHSFMELGLKYN